MRKQIIKIISVVFFAGLLTACGNGQDIEDFFNKGNNPFGEAGNNTKTGSSKNGNKGSSATNTNSNNNGGNGGNTNNTEVTFDENSSMFNHTFSECASGTVAIQAIPDGCKDTEIIVPSIYIDSTGARYKVVKDYGNGFGYLSATKITLLEGFEELHEGFDMCMYVKRIYLPSSITRIYEETFTSCVSLEKIDYDGTKAQWNAIVKDDRWNFKTPAIQISCKDGFIDIEKGPTE